VDRLDRVVANTGGGMCVGGRSMTHQRVVANRQFCVIRPVHRAWSSVTLCVLTLETVTGRWWMSRKTIEDRQTGGQIDGQSAVETARDRQTDGRWIDGQPTISIANQHKNLTL